MKIVEREAERNDERRLILARCVNCDAESSFSKQQLSAANRIWKVGSGMEGVTAREFLGGDGTTNQCSCGMECELVFHGVQHWETHWRKSRFVTGE